MALQNPQQNWPSCIFSGFNRQHETFINTDWFIGVNGIKRLQFSFDVFAARKLPITPCLRTG